MTAPAPVGDLVERFEEHREAYRSGRYGEAQLREESLNPFFEVLGWDVSNKKGHAEAYKQVIHEAAIKVGGRVAVLACPAVHGWTSQPCHPGDRPVAVRAIRALGGGDRDRRKSDGMKDGLIYHRGHGGTQRKKERVRLPIDA